MNEPQYRSERRVFSMVCRVEVLIGAAPERVWKLLTDAEGFPRWNSTVVKIEGEIREGERIRIHVPGMKRAFTPRVSDVVANQRMTWSDGVAPLFRGVRTFVLEGVEGNFTRFVMEERFAGIIFAMVKRVLPDFVPIFQSYAADLKREAERGV
jgi:hypothetical protein